LQESSDDREEIIETDGEYQELILAVKEYNTNRAHNFFKDALKAA
jgi:hypothetical protein